MGKGKPHYISNNHMKWDKTDPTSDDMKIIEKENENLFSLHGPVGEMNPIYCFEPLIPLKSRGCF